MFGVCMGGMGVCIGELPICIVKNFAKEVDMVDAGIEPPLCLSPWLLLTNFPSGRQAAVLSPVAALAGPQPVPSRQVVPRVLPEGIPFGRPDV